MTHRPKRRLLNKIRALAILLAAVYTHSCGPPRLVYKDGVPKTARAKFTTESCRWESHLRIPTTDTQFYLIDGRRSYALLVLDQHSIGEEIENYVKDDTGHHFSVTERRRAWQYSFPDERGAAGTLSYFEDSFRADAREHGFKIGGTPKGTCTLQSVPMPEVDDPQHLDAKAASVCAPGATQACTGRGACAGGQACLPNGSGWGSCDCGSNASAPQDPGGADRNANDASYDDEMNEQQIDDQPDDEGNSE